MDPSTNFDRMTPSDFEANLPDLFANANGKVSSDPRLQVFLAENPDCAALVKDLETIAEYAGSLFVPVEEPSDAVWAGIQAKLQEDPVGGAPRALSGVAEFPASHSGPLSREGEPDQLVTGGSLHDLD